MNKVILGDNPFFAISHLNSSKSETYLSDKKRFAKASEIIRECRGLNINDFMISCHTEAEELLEESGYSDTYVKDLPDICMVVPNVHQVNKAAAEGGLISAFGNFFANKFGFGKRGLVRLLSGLRYFGNTKYLALHNVVTDMLIGLDSAHVLNGFHYACRFVGLKSVLITFNPVKLRNMGVKCDIICTYYNTVGYNVCYEFDDLQNLKDKNSRPELWAMGIAASGAITKASDIVDHHLAQFDGALVASTKVERIRSMAGVLHHE